MATTSDISTIDYSGDSRVDALLALMPNWNFLLPHRTTLYYTFDLGGSAGMSAGPVTAFNASQKAAVVAILSHAASVTGISFTEVSVASAADLHFATTDLAGTGVAGQTRSTANYSSSSGGTLTAYSADAYVFLDDAEFADSNGAPAAGTAGFEVLLHEIGHALGLGHPFDEPHALSSARDNTDNTVMSYTHLGGAKSEFQEYDLLALQWIYGGDGLGGQFGYNAVYGPSLTLDPPPAFPVASAPPPAPMPAPPADDFVASRSTSGTVSIGGTARGSIEIPGDRDWFAVNLAAGVRYVFELQPLSSGDAELAEPAMRLLTGSATVLATGDDAGTSGDARIAFTPRVNGTYYLEVASATSDGTGSYQLAAQRDASNRAPVAAADAFSTTEDTPLSGDVLANDFDPDDQPLAVSLVSGPQHGELTLRADGTFTYAPRSGYGGIDTFVYRLSDGSLSASAAVTLTVSAVNDPPLARNAAIYVEEDHSRTGSLPAASDPDGDPLTYARHTTPSHGAVVIEPDGTYTYTPEPDFNGRDSFQYRVSDGRLSSSATVTVNVTAVNDAPLASNASVATDEDQPLSGDLPEGIDPDGEAVLYEKASDPIHGTVAIASDGGFTYVPADDYFGGDVFAFRVKDSAGASNTYQVGVSIRAVTDEILGTPGADTLFEHSGDAHLAGLAGDDRLRGDSGDDLIDGGPGDDAAIYAGNAREYVVARTGSGWTVTHPGGSEGTDRLLSVERLEFADRSFSLVNAQPQGVPGYGVLDHFLFDAVFYLLDNTDLVPVPAPDAAWQHYLAQGASQGRAPSSWFDAEYYENKWADLARLALDDATLFRHFNLFGVWEGRSPGPRFERFDGERYLAENPDVAAYVDEFVDDFLGSRTNGAIAHYLLYGAAEARTAYDLVGQAIDLGYVVEIGG